MHKRLGIVFHLSAATSLWAEGTPTQHPRPSSPSLCQTLLLWGWNVCFIKSATEAQQWPLTFDCVVDESTSSSSHSRASSRLLIVQRGPAGAAALLSCWPATLVRWLHDGSDRWSWEKTFVHEIGHFKTLVFTFPGHSSGEFTLIRHDGVSNLFTCELKVEQKRISTKKKGKKC